MKATLCRSVCIVFRFIFARPFVVHVVFALYVRTPQQISSKPHENSEKVGLGSSKHKLEAPLKRGTGEIRNFFSVGS